MIDLAKQREARPIRKKNAEEKGAERKGLPGRESESLRYKDSRKGGRGNGRLSPQAGSPLAKLLISSHGKPIKR